MDRETLNKLKVIDEKLKDSHQKLEALDYLKIVIWRDRCFFLVSLVILFLELQWWSICMVLLASMFWFREEQYYNKLKYEKSDNIKTKDDSYAELRTKFESDYNFELSFIKSKDSSKRLNLSSGNWVEYYE